MAHIYNAKEWKECKH